VRLAVIYNPLTAPYAASYLRAIKAAGTDLGVETLIMPGQSEG